MITLPNGERIKRHGTPSAYNKGCRCEECGDRHYVRMQVYSRRYRENIPPLDDPRHGSTINLYNNYGCRCQPCTETKKQAWADYSRKRKQAR